MSDNTFTYEGTFCGYDVAELAAEAGYDDAQATSVVGVRA